MESNVIKNIYDLEYSKMDKAEVVNNLNKLLASYLVFFHKLIGFHWNIVGQDYFNLRQKFRELYLKALGNISEIAERIRIFDQTPVYHSKDIVKLSEVSENEINLAGFEMMKDLLSDILVLLSLKEKCVKTASDLGDHGTETLVKNLIYEMEKDHRSLLSWVK
jgi:starvation-inducible DNA-binding protein